MALVATNKTNRANLDLNEVERSKMTSSGGFTASEVARLVMGHLKETNCDQSAESFKQECPPGLKLSEFANFVEQGILRGFDVDGSSLLDILNEYKE